MPDETQTLTRIARLAQRCAELRTPEAHLWARVVDMAREAVPDLVVSFSDPRPLAPKVRPPADTSP